VSEKPESCLVFPRGTTNAHLAGLDTGSSQAEICGSDNGNTHSSIGIATRDRVRVLPLFSQERGALLQQDFRVLAYEATGAGHGVAEDKVFPLFLLFVYFQDLGIGICDTNINDAVCAASRKIRSNKSPRGSPRFLCKLRETAGLVWSNSDISTSGQLECIKGSLRTEDGMIALATKSASVSLTSL
jgi:hypothetical protein